MGGTGRVNREVDAQFCERLEVKSLWLTRCVASCRPFRSSRQSCFEQDLNRASCRHIISNLTDQIASHLLSINMRFTMSGGS
jgi:hypothetical protein